MHESPTFLGLTPSPGLADDAHQDNVLMAEVAGVNNQLGRYVLRFLDTDAGRTAPLSTADERALADRLEAVVANMRIRAARRDSNGEPPRLVAHGTGSADV